MLTKFDKDLVENFGDDYKAYVYKITITFADETTKKIYIGAHLGSIYDSYDFSSEDEEFLNDYNNQDNKINLEIIMKGTVWDMFDLENRMLVEVDAKNPNNEYYNNTNGGSRYTSQSAEQEFLVDNIIHKFESGEYDKYIQYLPVLDIDGYETVQVRLKEEVVADKEYTDELAASINANHGKTDFLPSCLAYDKWFTTDKLWGDGSQRHEGVKKSKRGNTKKVKTIVLPKSIWKDLVKGLPKGEISDSMYDISCILNPLKPAPLPMKPSEIAIRVFDRSKSYDQIDSEYNRRFLAKQNRVGDPARKIIREAQQLWKNDVKAKAKGTNQFYHGATSVIGKKLIADGLAEVKEKFPNCIIVSASSSVFGVAHMEGVVQQKLGGDKQEKKYPTKLIKHPKNKPVTIVPVIFIPSTKYEAEWTGGKKAANYQSCKLYLEGTGFILGEPEYTSLIAEKVKGSSSA